MFVKTIESLQMLIFEEVHWLNLLEGIISYTIQYVDNFL